MPSISMFYGITIYMYNNGSEHNPPHFHAKYDGKFSTFNLDGTFKEGEMPAKQQRMVRVWADIHSEELKALWDMCLNKEALYRIEPLR